jgi:Vacuolar segregation subunit 7
MASGLDQHGRVRPDGYNSVVGKKSMKFTNSLHNLSDYHADGDTSTGPSTAGLNGTSRNVPHHIGRHGRTINPVSVLGNDAPLVATPTRMRNNQRHGSRSNTPRGSQFVRSPTGPSQKYSVYELDDDDGADDEETPLIRSAHSQRSYYGRNNRRGGARYRPGSRSGRSKGFVQGAFGWVLLGSLVTVLIAAVVTTLVLCSKPLHDVRIGEISNVIASEEEVVFDIQMFGTNPNLVAIQIDQLDMKIFAKSKYVGSTARPSIYGADEASSTNESGPLPDATDHERHKLSTWDSVDDGTDPIDDEPGSTDTMLLGRAYRLDSPLSFAPSPFSHARVSDVGEISLNKPGNRTADDGTDRWKTVVQHPFDLIVVGQLKYTLPISSKLHSVSVGRGRVRVTPNEPEEPPAPPPPDHGGKNRTNATSPGFMPGPVKVKTHPISMHFAA